MFSGSSHGPSTHLRTVCSRCASSSAAPLYVDAFALNSIENTHYAMMLVSFIARLCNALCAHDMLWRVAACVSDVFACMLVLRMAIRLIVDADDVFASGSAARIP